MATRHKESVAGKEKRGVSPMSSSTPTELRRSPRPSTPPGTTVAKDHGKTPATTGEPRKHVPNYLKPTISSHPDAAKQTGVRKSAHDDTHKPTPTMMRRRSFDRPAPPSQVQRGSTARTPPFSPKHSASATRPASSSSDRISKVVKAVKSQPPFLKATKSMPRTSSSSGARKEVKTSNLKKATPSAEEEPVHAPNTIESEADDEESLDLNVEEELAKMESPVDFPPENHISEDKEHIDEENQSPKEHLDETNNETLISIETTVSEDHQDEQEHTPKPVAENVENVEVTQEAIQVVLESQDIQEETQVVHESQDTHESDQQSIHAVNEAPGGDTKEDEKDTEKETIEEIKPVGLTVKTTPDDDEEAVEEEQGKHDLEGRNEGQSSNEQVHKINEEEKPAISETENVVHKHQVGGPRNKKESPAYNDVIEETASKLVGKRVNKVRALAGAFETVISLQQPDSS